MLNLKNFMQTGCYKKKSELLEKKIADRKSLFDEISKIKGE